MAGGGRPRLRDIVAMSRALARGSEVDKPRSLVGALLENRTDTPADSPRALSDVVSDPTYGDLMTPKVAPGDQAPDFELPLHDFSDGAGRTTGESFRLSDRRGARPVALVFGSYT